ncbi:MAG: hypothetical protein IPL27_21970 [Lewinellaceae bacterium]|nr:hypothetical protein [Lewinellaceae bacterium]
MLPERTYPFLFFAIVLAYCLLYAPYGINETDGGFLSGLGWQALSGKTIYQDIVYVRPPLPVWLRALEIQLLPEARIVLGERYIFYFKVALYTCLASDLLAKGSFRWVLAMFGFIVSVHTYPACAWHTIDGILFSILALWLYAKGSRTGSVLAGISFAAALLCKQSFFPLLVAFPLIFLVWDHARKKQRIIGFAIGFSVCIILFFNYLYQKSTLENFLLMTGSSASGGQALQHGFLDYLRIKPVLAIISLLLLIPVIRWFWKQHNPRVAEMTWSLWLGFLLGSYVLDFWIRQEFTAPFSQARLLFLTGVAYAGRQLAQWWQQRRPYTFRLPDPLARLILLLAISWSAAVSWGYNLPILLATPWMFTTFEISRLLREHTIGHFLTSRPIRFWKPYRSGGRTTISSNMLREAFPKWLPLLVLAILLSVARFGYEFVYRDGPRGEMTVDMGTIFPKLHGIYSSPQTAALYSDLKDLSRRYGPDFAVLPAFPQAHFLTNTAPPLPLDWVVQREMNGANQLVINSLKEKKPVLFIEKSFADKINIDPELELTRHVLETGKVLEETPHFWIVRYE